MTSVTPAVIATLVATLRAAGCVFAEDEAALLTVEADGAELEALVARRVAGEPLEHLLGWAAFAGLRVAVGPGVFVPRRRTEHLVRQAISLIRDTVTVIDLCCGSGAIGLAVDRYAECEVDLWSADLDPAAVACARRNLPPDRVLLGDLFEPLPGLLRGKVDLLLVNAPYVPTAAIGAMPPEARDHEPHVTLDGGADGLDVHRRVVRVARDWLVPGGALIVETGRTQAPVVARLFGDHALEPEISRDDELDATVVIGRRI